TVPRNARTARTCPSCGLQPLRPLLMSGRSSGSSPRTYLGVRRAGRDAATRVRTDALVKNRRILARVREGVNRTTTETCRFFRMEMRIWSVCGTGPCGAGVADREVDSAHGRPRDVSKPPAGARLRNRDPV